MFVTFEGIDGCGKTTQLQRLAKYLRDSGREVVATREPGGTRLAEEVRSMLLSVRAAGEAPTNRAEVLLFAAARAQHVDALIRPALERGAWVLCDRFTDSTVAYQAIGLGMELKFVRALNEFATNSLQPDLTLLFDLPVEVALERRARARGEDRIEGRGATYQQRVRNGFLQQATREPRRIAVVDASPDPDAVHQQVLEVLAARLT